MENNTPNQVGLLPEAKPYICSEIQKHSAADFGRVAVVMGDDSPEREVSLTSGAQVLKALSAAKVHAEKFDPIDGIDGLNPDNFDRAFIALHGPAGEDGQIQGYLERVGLPYTGTSVLGSAMAMDKVATKYILNGLGIATPAFGVPTSLMHARQLARNIGYPIFMKPISVGSSVGAFVLEDETALVAAYEKAKAFGAVMIEQLIDGIDYTIGFISDHYLPSIKIEPSEGFYDYEAKYKKGNTKFTCPSGLDPKIEQDLANQSYLAYQALHLRHIARADWMRGSDGQFWMLELNTLPGLTPTSLVPTAAKAVGLSFQDMILELLAHTICSPVKSSVVHDAKIR